MSEPIGQIVCAPESISSVRQWKDFFNMVCCCDDSEAVLVETQDVNKQRTFVGRWAQRLNYQVSTHVIEGKLYVTPKIKKNGHLAKPPEFSYRSLVMPRRPEAR